ncbi:MAG TPA: carbohydrate kinase family protein [Anaerolineales bacterium]|nr:carbohydrate kinase family protein [Anaerolineales bacterium]HNB36804.1 carbohydrate kinase family protein [Anaerolineales bacterium]HNC08851.1 carbohydrate kinase family protein [Anaerolineales bacterium]
MPNTFAIAGKLTREYLIPPVGVPIIDSPGGSLLYAAGGLAVWDKNIALIARINESFPGEWLDAFYLKGFDVSGIRSLPEAQDADLRSFMAYLDLNERTSTSPVSQFARRGVPFPKSLLGYQPHDEANRNPREIDPLAPSALEVPKEYRDVGYVHLCPFDFTSQGQLVSLFKGGSTRTVSLDPAPSYMKPTFWRDLRLVLQGVNIFLPSEDELRTLFWGESNDLWSMAQHICEYGPEIVVVKRGTLGQLVYDATAKRRYEIPAYAARVADPTGAGDAFCGGFLAGFQRTNDPLMAALYGNVSASLKVEGTGPFYPLEVMPGLAEARLYSMKEFAREI